MSPHSREVAFQIVGGLLALAIALAGTYATILLLGRLGRLAVIWAVPVGIAAGYATICLLRFAHRILSDEE